MEINYSCLRSLPQIGTQDHNNQTLALVKFVDTESQWTWYCIESDGNLCFGLVIGIEAEFGLFYLEDLLEVNKSAGFSRIKQDVSFVPTAIAQLMPP